MSDTALLNLSIGSKKALADIGQFNAGLKSIGKNLALSVTAPILAMGTFAVKTFSEMESGLTNIKNLLDLSGIKTMSAELEGLQETAIEAGFGIQDVSKALFDNVSALGNGQVALDSFTQAQKLAKGGNADLGVAVDGLTSVINAYGRDTTNASDVANAFFSAQQKGKTTVSELAANIGKVAPVAKSAGIGFKELLATMSTLTLGGLSTDEATTSLRSTISALVKPTKEAEKVLKSLGVPVGALELKEKGLGFALAQLSKAQEENADIIAKAIPNIRALTGVTSFSEDKLKILAETQQKMNDDIKNGTGLNEAYNRTLLDFGDILKSTVGSTSTARKEIGKMIVEGLHLKDAFKIVTEKVIDFKNWLKSLTSEQRNFMVVATAVAAAMPLVVVGITSIVGAGLALVSTISAIATGIIPLIAGLGTLAEVGIIAGAGLFSAFGTDWIPSIDSMIEGVKFLSSNIMGFIHNFGENWKILLSGLSENWGIVTSWIADNFSTILTKDFPRMIGVMAGNFVNNMLVSFKAIFELFTITISYIGTAWLNFWSGDATTTISDALSNIFTGFMDWAAQVWEGMKDVLMGNDGLKLDLSKSFKEGVDAANTDGLFSALGASALKNIGLMRNSIEGFKSQTEDLVLKPIEFKLEVNLDKTKEEIEEIADRAKDIKTDTEDKSKDTEDTEDTEAPKSSSSFVGAIEKGTIEAVKLEQGTQGNKTERDTLRENKRQTNILDKIASTITPTEEFSFA